jgi:Ca2+-binding RTX toxin-like protein
MGVDDQWISNPDPSHGSNPASETMTFELYDSNNTTDSTADDDPANVDQVGFTIDSLSKGHGSISGEVLYWTAEYYDESSDSYVTVGSGQITGNSLGASDDADQQFLIINDSSGVNDNTTQYTDGSFSRITFSAADGSDYRVLSMTVYDETDAADHILTYDAIATDYDGDTTVEQFDVTFDGDDIINGTDADEVISGGSGVVGSNLSGDSIIYGGGGDDIIYGNDGNDVLIGGDGADTLNGGDGDDVLVGDEITYDDTTKEFEVTGDGDDDILNGGDGTNDSAVPDEEIPGATDGGVEVEVSDVDLDTLIPPPDGA